MGHWAISEKEEGERGRESNPSRRKRVRVRVRATRVRFRREAQTMSTDGEKSELVWVTVMFNCGESGSFNARIEATPEMTIGEVMVKAAEKQRYPI